MSDYHIALPSKPRVVSESERSGTYEIDGLYPGYGFTLGNSLRRIIRSSLPGAAVTPVKSMNVSRKKVRFEAVITWPALSLKALADTFVPVKPLAPACTMI